MVIQAEISAGLVNKDTLNGQDMSQATCIVPICMRQNGKSAHKAYEGEQFKALTRELKGKFGKVIFVLTGELGIYNLKITRLQSQDHNDLPDDNQLRKERRDFGVKWETRNARALRKLTKESSQYEVKYWGDYLNSDKFEVAKTYIEKLCNSQPIESEGYEKTASTVLNNVELENSKPKSLTEAIDRCVEARLQGHLRLCKEQSKTCDETAQNKVRVFSHQYVMEECIVFRVWDLEGCNVVVYTDELNPAINYVLESVNVERSKDNRSTLHFYKSLIGGKSPRANDSLDESVGSDIESGSRSSRDSSPGHSPPTSGGSFAEIETKLSHSTQQNAAVLSSQEQKSTPPITAPQMSSSTSMIMRETGPGIFSSQQTRHFLNGNVDVDVEAYRRSLKTRLGILNLIISQKELPEMMEFSDVAMGDVQKDYLALRQVAAAQAGTAGAAYPNNSNPESLPSTSPPITVVKSLNP